MMYKLGFLLLTAMVFTGTLVGEVGAISSQSVEITKATWTNEFEDTTLADIKDHKISDATRKNRANIGDVAAGVYTFWYAKH